MSGADQPILDAGVLAELAESVGGDREFVVDLVETYLLDGATQLADIEAAFAARDAELIVRPAHTLKSSSATVGAMEVASLAREIELAGRSGALDGLPPDIDAPMLRAAWERASAALRTWSEAGEGS